MHHRKRSTMLANERVGRLLMRLSIPAIISMMVHAVYNTVDTIFIGQWVGTLGIGAIAITLPIMMLIVASMQTIGFGGASLVSRSMGARDMDGAALTLGNMTLLGIILGMVVQGIGIFALSPLLRLFGTTPALFPMAYEYFQVIMLAGPVMTLSMVVNDAVRAEGNAKMAMATMIAGAVLNIVLDPIFIYVLKMGVRGAAVATVLSMLLSFIMVLVYFLSGRSEIDIGLRYLRLKLDILKEILSVGSSAFARVGAMSLTVTFINQTLSHYGGEVGIATFGVIFRMLMFIFMPIMGLVLGLQPVVGFNYGARLYNRVKQGLKLTMIASTVVSTTGFVVVFFFPEEIMRAFTSDSELVASGCNGLRLSVFCLPIVGAQIIGGGFFQALGKALPALLLTLSRQVLVLLPLVIVLPRFWGVNGVWLSFPVADAISFLVTLVFVLAALNKFPDNI